MDRLTQFLTSNAGMFFLGISLFSAGIGGTADIVLDEDESPGRPTAVPLTYKGQEPDAPWRKEAAARIEAQRKATVAVLVTDASGQPAAGADVSVKMKRHGFSWGAAARAAFFVEKPTLNLGPGVAMPDKGAITKYQQLLPALFNRSGLNIDLRDDWTALNQAEILRAIEWLRSHDMNVRGYTLVWPDWGHSKWAARFKDRDSLNKEIARRISSKVEALKGKVDEWDVVNEAKNNITSANSMFLMAGGVDAMVEWCKAARQADPQARLFIADDGVLDSNTTPTWQNKSGKPTHLWIADRIYEYLQQLIARQAPFDGIAFHGHFKQPAFFAPPDQVYQRLERFAALGKQLAITELEVAVPDPKDDKQAKLQADYTRDLLTVFFSHPKITEVTFWSIWEPEARKNPGALFRADGAAKPNGEAVTHLLRQQWWTELTGKTDASGKFEGRGFLGKYEITAAQGGKTRTVPLDLAPDAKPVVIKLD